MRLSLYLYLSVFCILLAACGFFNPDPERYDGFEIALTAEADKTQTKVGDSVTVTLTGGFELPSQSRLTENVHEDLKLGACVFFGEAASEVRGGLCRDEDLPLPSEFQLLAGTHHVRESTVRS